MKVNLTLTMKPEVIGMAKQIAKANGTSVSFMFTQFVRAASLAERRSKRTTRSVRRA